MQTIRVSIRVTGFLQEEAEGGIPDLVEEMEARPWLIRPQARWDQKQGVILIQVERAVDSNDHNGEGTLDEVWDCVIATINFSSQGIQFVITAIETGFDTGDDALMGAG